MTQTVPFGWQFLDRIDPTSGATLSITPATGYSAYKLYFDGITSNAQDQFLGMQLNVAGVAQTGAADYGFIQTGAHNIGAAETTVIVGDESHSIIDLFGGTAFGGTDNPGIDAGETCDGEITVFGLATTGKTKITGLLQFISSDGEHIGYQLVASALVAEANDGFTFDWEGATEFASGSIYMFGLKVPTA